MSSKKKSRPTRRPQLDSDPIPPRSATPAVVEAPSGGAIVGRPLLHRGAMVRTDWRIGLLVVAMCGCIYLPTLGSFGMYDPWETIYTEVGRQFMERDDWMSPYWHNGTGPEGWSETNFWSKPVGSFWLSGLSLKLFGWEDDITLRGSGRSLADPAAASNSPKKDQGPDPGEVLATRPVEWAVRTPFFLCGLFGIFCIYLMCSRLFGRRAGVLSALVLATSPMYFFITRQAMTDMPYVGLVSGGLALFTLAMFGEKELLRRKELRIGRFALSWPHDAAYYAFVAFFLLCMALIFSALVPPLLRLPIPALPVLSHAIWLAIYGVTALVFVALSLGTRTRNEIYLYVFYAVTAIAGLAKGLIGALQPGFIIALYLLTSREWRILSEVALARGLLISGSIFAPWWHAMVMKYGASFWNELVGTEQMRRLTVGEQKQAKGTWEYYVQQIGYGLFPWVAFLPGALVDAFRSAPRHERSGQERARLFCYVWFAGAMLLFTLTLTKYHHYILPAIPPAAIVIALHLDDLLARRSRGTTLALLAAIVVLVLVAADLYFQPANWVWMFTYLYEANWAHGAPPGVSILVYAAVCALTVVAAFWQRLRKTAIWTLVAVAIAGGGFVLARYQQHCAFHWGQKYVLQTYYKLRKGPEEQLIAWQFNWRGETWYTAAQVVVSKSLKNKPIQDWLSERQGRRFFFITERSRYPSLQGMLPTAKGRETLRIVDDSNVHFVLAEATI